MITSWTWLSLSPADEMLHEAGPRLQVLDGAAAAVAHARAQAAHELLDHGGERPLVGDHALDALGHQLVAALVLSWK